MSTRAALAALASEIAECRACPRLVAWRERVGREKRRAYRDETYWARPVAGFGDPDARIVIVGLAPGAHGANRTGRVFTGDRSGDFLYAALARAGLANQATSTHASDGLALSDVFITMPVRCAPPDNLPTSAEIAACEAFFRREVTLLARRSVYLALGALAFRATLRLLEAPAAPFQHGRHLELGRGVHVLASYHVSQQNTQTGRLTPAMFDELIGRAVTLATGAAEPRGRARPPIG